MRLGTIGWIIVISMLVFVIFVIPMYIIPTMEPTEEWKERVYLNPNLGAPIEPFNVLRVFGMIGILCGVAMVLVYVVNGDNDGE